jgi:predicted Zn finger-like uncharacterized protein
LIIVCNSCSAQYSVSDAKVRGKLVRITCKHCSTAIVVDGRQMMSEAEVPAQKPLAAYVLPRRDESVVAHMPQSIAPARAKAAVSSPSHAAVSAPAPVHSPLPPEMREEERTMIARSRFGDEMSVHEERTVIGQIPREALEFERMFAQRTQPPPPDEKNEAPTAPPPAAPAMVAPAVPSFSSAPPPENPADSVATDRPSSETRKADDETDEVRQEESSRSEPPTRADKPISDSRGLVSLAEATHPSVVRSASARRLRVTLVTLLVLAVLVGLFVFQKPH